MNDEKTEQPKKIKSLKLVRETLRELDGADTTPVAGRPFTRNRHCASFAF